MNPWKILKKNKKREVRLILTLHPSLLQCSPICHFYFLGSPLCFSSCCLHLSVPSRSYQAPSEPITVAPFHPKDTPNLPGLTNLSANSASCLKQAMNRTNKHTLIWQQGLSQCTHEHTTDSLNVFTCVSMQIRRVHNYRFFFPPLLWRPLVVVPIQMMLKTTTTTKRLKTNFKRVQS